MSEMTEKERKFISDLTKQALDHEGWLVLIRFGLKTFLENQFFFLEIVRDEVQREQKRLKLNPDAECITTARVFNELGVRLIVAPMNLSHP